MSVHMKKEIDRLKEKLIALCSNVEDRLQQAVKSIKEHNFPLAKQVIDSDVEIDRMEVEIEEDCLKILALYQPVAIDLRFIITVLKINSDLERIGDLAVNMAQRCEFFDLAPENRDILCDFDIMAEKAQAMLRNSLGSLVNMNNKLAHEVCLADDEVDALKRKIKKQVGDNIRPRPELQRALIELLSIAHDLERIADHTTNIAEDVIYMIDGEIVRHKIEG